MNLKDYLTLNLLNLTNLEKNNDTFCNNKDYVDLNNNVLDFRYEEEAMVE